MIETIFTNIVLAGRVNRQPTTNDELLESDNVTIVKRQNKCHPNGVPG